MQNIHKKTLHLSSFYTVLFTVVLIVFSCSEAIAMTYSSSTTTQVSTSVVKGTTKRVLIGIEIVTVGPLPAINATNFSLNTNGTTNTTDITNATLWYTSTSGTFATTNQFGTAIVSPNGAFNITGLQALAIGTNYFWLSYDVPFTATMGNFIDAECTSLTVDGNVQTPTITTPIGNREITAQTTFYATYDKGSNGGGSDLHQTPDGGFIRALTDYSGSGPFGGSDSYLQKTDAAGNTQWSKYYGGAGADEVFSLDITNDGGYIMGSYSTSFATGVWHVVKTNATGNVQWSDSYCNCGTGLIDEIKQISGGGYIIAGHNSYNFYLVKIDNTGTEVWDNLYTKAGSDIIYGVEETTDGGFIFGGIVDWSVTVSSNIAIGKTNSVGTTLWMKKYEIGGNVDQLMDIKQTPDGGYIIAGYTNSAGAGGHDGLLIKVDSLGSVEWSNSYGGANHEYFYGMDLTSDGGYILNGYTTSFGLGGVDHWLSKIDATGAIEWSHAFGDANSDFGWKGIEQTTDGGYILGGNTLVGPVLIKTNEQGYAECNVMDITPLVTTTNLSPIVTDPSASFTIASNSAPDWIPAAEGEIATATTDSILCSQIVAISANFNNTTTCQGDSTSFTNTSTGGATSWLWDFDDPSSGGSDSSTLENPTHLFTTAGTYNVQLTISIGSFIDSITVSIVVNPTYTILDSATICSADSIFIGGNWQNTAGTYYDSLATLLGCDSIIETTLTVNPSPLVLVTISICPGDSIFLGGAFQSTPNTYYDTLSTSLGCDSIIATTLSIILMPTTNIASTICQGDSLLINGLWQNTSGSYPDTLQTSLGCDSIVNTTLTVNPIYNNSVNTSICNGDSLLLGGAWQNTSGTYIDSLVTVFGCDSITTTTLIVSPLPIIIANNDTTIDIGTTISLIASGGVNYTWSPPTGLSCINCSNPDAFPENTITYIITGTDLNGCTNSTSVTITVNDFYDLFLPNIFSPNNDGNNDLFLVRGHSIKTMNLIIYNRWGQKVFESSSQDSGWDGTFNGQDVNSGVFVYYLTLENYSGEHIEQKGNITLVR